MTIEEKLILEFKNHQADLFKGRISALKFDELLTKAFQRVREEEREKVIKILEGMEVTKFTTDGQEGQMEKEIKYEKNKTLKQAINSINTFRGVDS